MTEVHSSKWDDEWGGGRWKSAGKVGNGKWEKEAAEDALSQGDMWR